MQVNPEEFKALLNNPAFKLYKSYMKKMKEDIKTSWARGDYTCESDSGTIQLNARQIGKVELIDHLLDNELTYETIMEFLNDE